MNIVVDVREHSLIEKLNGLPISNPNITITTEQLLLGDVVLRINNTNEVLLFERKSLPDLLASIKDGRYKEQSHRLTHTSGLNSHHIIYIIEGVFSTLRTPLDKKLVLSAIASLSYFKGFSVFRTATILETAEIVLAMASKLQKEFEGGAQPLHSLAPLVEGQSIPVEGPTTEDIIPYSAFVRKAKRDNITPENIGEILLCQIPGISTTVAQAILKQFDGSFSKLVEEIKTNPEKLEMVFTETNGKRRRISSSVIQSILTYLTK